MASIYGLSKFIIAPMTQNLTEARHDFAAHTQEQLEEFNKRLGESVSVDPATKAKVKASDALDDVSEAGNRSRARCNRARKPTEDHKIASAGTGSHTIE
jgi:hypothetical protein